MKKIFITLTFASSHVWKDCLGNIHRSKSWVFVIETWIIIKEYNHSRCTDFKKLLKVQALARFLPG